MGFLAVIVAGGALIMVLRDPDPDPEPTSTTTTNVSTTTTMPVTAPTPAPTPAPVPTIATIPPVTTVAPATPGVGGLGSATVLAEVNRTCGADGGGDCFLSVRSAPNSDAREVIRLSEGDALSITCTVVGEAVTSSVLGRATSIWARTPDGTFVSMAFVDAPGFDPFTNSHPC